MQYSEVLPKYEIRQLIELSVRVAAGELGCALPDVVHVLVPDPDGNVTGPAAVHGWCYASPDDAEIFLVDVESRAPRDLTKTIYHEMQHLCDGLKAGSTAAILAGKQQSEDRAQRFASQQVEGLPTYSAGIVAALERRLYCQRFPISHAEALVVARKELARLDLEKFDSWDEVN